MILDTSNWLLMHSFTHSTFIPWDSVVTQLFYSCASHLERPSGDWITYLIYSQPFSTVVLLLRLSHKPSPPTPIKSPLVNMPESLWPCSRLERKVCDLAQHNMGEVWESQVQDNHTVASYQLVEQFSASKALNESIFSCINQWFLWNLKHYTINL